MTDMHMVFSKRGVSALIRKIRRWESDNAKKIQAIIADVADTGVAEAVRYFGANCFKVPITNGYEIVAQGHHVCFVEFGTGVYTDSGHEYAGKVEINVYPGSWSEEHAGTWQKWLADGKDPYAYPYNNKPQYGMVHVMNAMRQKWEEYCK